ncbi:MAG: hypothetical protein ACM3RQ_00370 [Methanocella sp.]
MREARLALAIFSLGFLFGCATAGRDFPRPTEQDLKLGQTSKVEVIGKYGPPKEERTVTMKLKAPDAKEPDPNAESGLLTRAFYSFVDPRGDAIDGVSPQRAAYFWFWNDKLISYHYLSSFKQDSTDFPTDAITKIERGKSTESEVRALLGQPSGYGIYPETKYPEDRSLVYAYFEWNKAHRNTQFKKLMVYIKPDGVVRDLKYDNSTKGLPPPPASSGGVTTIYVPSKR